MFAYFHENCTNQSHATAFDIKSNAIAKLADKAEGEQRMTWLFINEGLHSKGLLIDGSKIFAWVSIVKGIPDLAHNSKFTNRIVYPKI